LVVNIPAAGDIFSPLIYVGQLRAQPGLDIYVVVFAVSTQLSLPFEQTVTGLPLYLLAASPHELDALLSLTATSPTRV
jgi:hypothetical protein